MQVLFKKCDHKVFFLLSLIVSITFLSFLPTLKNGFTNWDDIVYVTGNPSIRTLNLSNLHTIFTSTPSQIYSPLTLLSFALEYRFFGLNAFFYHLDNLLLHLAITVLIFYFSTLLGLSYRAAFFGALIFGIHPMHVESVAWVTERKDVLYVFLYMAALCFYLHYLKNGKLLYYVVTFPLGLLSMLAKPQALSFPLTLLVCDWFFGRKVNNRVILEKIPYLFYIVPIAWITYFQNTNILSKDIGEAIILGIWSLNFYILKFILPFNLVPAYATPLPISLMNAPYAIFFILMMAFIVLLIRFRNHRLLVFSFLFYFFSIFYLIRFNKEFSFNLVADRYMYLSSMGFCMLTGYGIEKIWMKLKNMSCFAQNGFKFIIIIMYCYFFFYTFRLTHIWKDSITLWSYVISKSPTLAVPYNKRGEAFSQNGLYELAIEDYNKSLKINNAQEFIAKENRYTQSNITRNNSIFQAYFNRGNAYNFSGQYDLALGDYNQAIKSLPLVPQPYNNRGLMYLKLKKYDLAIEDFTQALKQSPNYFEAYNNRGYAYTQAGQYNEALNDLNKAISINPQIMIAYYNRGNVFRLKGLWESAIMDFNRTIDFQSDHAFAYFYRSLCYQAKNDIAQALNDALKAQSLGLNQIDGYVTGLKQLLSKYNNE